MKKLIDKLIIFIVSLALCVLYVNNMYVIVPILISIFLSATLSYLEEKNIEVVVFMGYIIMCFFEPSFLFFLPLICYDVIFHKWMGLWLLSLIPLISDFALRGFTPNWLIAGLIGVSYILKHRTVALRKLEKDYHQLRDNAKEISMQLEKQNNELLKNQDYEINLATITERNRIARDIHDNVGHMLSRSILQIGALLAINKDEEAGEGIHMIKETLLEAMNSIRTSVHNLHEESINLQTEIQKLINSFKFCTILLEYDVKSNLDREIKYCFIAVIKEAMSNIINHSNATEASVKIKEHPALFQLVIQDNGTNCSYSIDNGIGLKNISDRVTALGGNVNISTDKGFRIFISIQKNKEFGRNGL